MADISPEEREAVLKKIDKLIAENRINPPSPTEVLPARSKGSALPLFANIAIIFVVAGVLLFFSLRLNREESAIVSHTDTVLTAESEVIAEVRAQSEAELRSKDLEIRSAQKQLQEAEAERKRLSDRIEARVQARERSLNAEIEAAIDKERARLEKEGVTTPVAQARLTEMKAELQRETQAQIDEYRRQVELESSEQIANLSDTIKQYESKLEQTQSERSALEQEFRRKEADLRAQMVLQPQTETNQAAAAAEELSQLEQSRKQAEFLTSQVLAAYERAREELASQHYEAAGNTLEALRATLDTEPVRSNPQMQQRRQVDLFIIDSLRELIGRRIAAEQTPPTAVSEAAGETEPPDREDSATTVDSRADTDREGSRQNGLNMLDNASRAFADDDFSRTLNIYREALTLLVGNRQLAGRIVAELSEAGYRIGAVDDAQQYATRYAARYATAQAALEADERLSERIERLKQEIRTTNGDGAVSGEDTQLDSANLGALLQAKLLTWQIIGSEPVKSEHPHLYETMERYIDSLSAQQRSAGRRAAFTDVLAVLTALTGSSASGESGFAQRDAGSELMTPDGLDAQELVTLLDALQQLVTPNLPEPQ